MAKADKAAAVEVKDVRLMRLQDRYITDAMSRTEADGLIAGYPGEFEEIMPVSAPAEAPAADEAASAIEG